jgi:AcrR family transcriptional regulator
MKPTSRDPNPAALARREQIRDAARAVIEEHGPDALTSQIAKRAGLARPNVYRHFASKDDLDQAVASNAYQELRAAIRAQLDPRGTPLDAIRAPIEAHIIWAEKHQNLYQFLVSRGHQRNFEQRTAQRSDYAAELAATIGRYIPRFTADPDAAEATLIGLIGLFDASVLRWLSGPVGTREQLIDRLTAQVWLVLDHHLRECNIHIDPAAPLSLTAIVR